MISSMTVRNCGFGHDVHILNFLGIVCCKYYSGHVFSLKCFVFI